MRAFDMVINIAELLEKGKYWAFYGRQTDQVYQLIIMICVAAGAFACGRLSIIDEKFEPVAIQNVFETSAMTSMDSSSPRAPEVKKEGIEGTPKPVPSPGSVVGSKNGSKYHLPWCSGVKTIKEENKVWFASEAEAQAAGYTKAGNCK